jgi:integrase
VNSFPVEPVSAIFSREADHNALTQAKRGKAKERGNGDGTLYQLSSGRWAWQITYEEFGKIKRRSGSAADKTQAKRDLDQARRDRELGLLSNADRITVNELAAMWLEGQTDMGTRASKMGRDEISYVLEIIGPMKVKDVQRNTLEKAIRALVTRPMGRRDENGNPPENAAPMSHRTVGKSLMRLKALFEYAVICKIRHDNPSLGLKRPKSRTPQAETVGTVLDIDEKARFHEIGSALYAAGVCALWPAIFTALAVGLRRSEVMGLRWKDVDFDAGVIKVRHTSVAQSVGGFELAETTKTTGSRRDIDMPSSLRAMLETHQAHQKLEQEKAGSSWRDSGAVFATALGWWISPDNLNRAVNNILGWSDKTMLLERYKPDTEPSRTAKKGEDVTNLERRMRAVKVDHRPRLEAIVRAGEKLPDIRVHDLRHTYATTALRSRVPVAVVSKTLGHARISITLDIYRHVLPSEMKENVFDMFAVPIPVREVPVISVN